MHVENPGQVSIRKSLVIREGKSPVMVTTPVMVIVLTLVRVLINVLLDPGENVVRLVMGGLDNKEKEEHVGHVDRQII